MTHKNQAQSFGLKIKEKYIYAFEQIEPSSFHLHIRSYKQKNIKHQQFNTSLASLCTYCLSKYKYNRRLQPFFRQEFSIQSDVISKIEPSTIPQKLKIHTSNTIPSNKFHRNDLNFQQPNEYKTKGDITRNKNIKTSSYQ